MLEALKSLFENNAISEEIRAEIEQAWFQTEEHTSELQSRSDLVCRLLLEKKKKNKKQKKQKKKKK